MFNATLDEIRDWAAGTDDRARRAQEFLTALGEQW